MAALSIHKDDLAFDEHNKQSRAATSRYKNDRHDIGPKLSLDNIDEVLHDIVLDAILSLWYCLYSPISRSKRFAICTLRSPWDIVEKDPHYFIGDSMRVIIPFIIGEHDIIGEKNDGTIVPRDHQSNADHVAGSHTLLAIATKHQRHRNIDIQIIDTNNKRKKRDQVLHCVRSIIKLCGWAKNEHNKHAYINIKGQVRFAADTTWVPVTQRIKEYDSCAVDTILCAWTTLLGLESRTRRPGNFFNLEVYEKAREVINLALEGKLHAMTAATFLVSSEFVKTVPEVRSWSNVQTVAMNYDVMESIARDLHGPPIIKIQGEDTNIAGAPSFAKSTSEYTNAPLIDLRTPSVEPLTRVTTPLGDFTALLTPHFAPHAIAFDDSVTHQSTSSSYLDRRMGKDREQDPEDSGNHDADEEHQITNTSGEERNVRTPEIDLEDTRFEASTPSNGRRSYQPSQKLSTTLDQSIPLKRKRRAKKQSTAVKISRRGKGKDRARDEESFKGDTDSG